MKDKKVKKEVKEKKLLKKLNLKKKKTSKKAVAEPAPLKKLTLLVTIVPFDYREEVTNLLKEGGVSFSSITAGMGTSNAFMSDIFSLVDYRKAVFFSIVPLDIIPDTFDLLNGFFNGSKKHLGIAFTIDLTSIIGKNVYKFLVKE